MEVADLESERVKKLLEVSHTVDRWRELFSALNQGEPYGNNQDNDAKVVKELSMTRAKVPLATPAKIEAKPKREITRLGSLEESVEIDLQEEIHINISESLENEWSSLPSSIILVLKDIAKAISEISTRFIGISRDMAGTESMWDLIGSDLENLDASLRQIKGLIGEPVEVNGSIPPNVWTGIDAASGSNSAYNEKLSKSIQELQQKLNSVSNTVETFKQQQQRYWTTLAPTIRQIKLVVTECLKHPPKNLESRIKILEDHSTKKTDQYQKLLEKVTDPGFRMKTTIWALF